MQPEQFQRARRVFDEAMTRETDARAAFLAEACADDPAVRAEVERLMAQATSGSPLTAAKGAIDEMLRPEVGSGSVVSHYRLEARIGAGGMGEVYRAEDLALGRTAAVKVLPAGLAGPYRDRLLAEAKMSARLQHPGIATFFEGGETDDGIAFLAMEYVEGETLRTRLRRGPLEVDSALRTVASLLEALAHAHSCDVIHRDIKPENVIRRKDGTVKLLDFGIAKRVDVSELALDSEAPTVQETRSALTQLTRHGSIVGTIGYMAPEQLRGEPVDVRTDLFAVGAVLYEAIAGKPAFPGAGSAQRIAATLSGEVPSLGIPEAGPDLNAVIRRALSRDRTQRYGSASEFLRDLGALASGEALAILPDTLAILDFETRGGQEDDWIGSAVADSLAADLSRVEGLGILPREKVGRSRAAHPDGDPVKMGLALGCRWVLAGTVQRMGPRVRITHRLLEVATGNVAHTEKTDGEYDDLFALQDRVASSVAGHLHVALPERTTGRSAERDLDVHECVARGKAALHGMSRGKIDEAERWLLRAVELEPGHAEALELLAQLHAPTRWVINTDAAELEQAIGFARRSIEVDPRQPNPHVWLGYARWRQGRFEDALKAYEGAIELAPTHPWAHYFAANTLIEKGDFERAVGHARRAVSADAPTPFQYVALGWSLQMRGDFEEALWALERAVELEARGGPMHAIGAGVYVADCLLALGRVDEARRRATETLEAIERTDHGFRDIYRTSGLCALGRIALAQQDPEAARAAATQSVAHVRGRSRGSGLGFTLVTALALLARIDRDAGPYEEALRLYLGREGYDFHMAGIGAFHARDELLAAARELDRHDDVPRIHAAATTPQGTFS